MDEKKLSKRLTAVARHVSPHAVLADIGSDHAYLPAHLVLTGKIERAIAGEVVDGPYQSAKKLVTASRLADKIDVRFGDGLEVIRPEDNVTDITICGMGGKLIRDILDRGRISGWLTGQERLVLQPNVGEPLLRTWLTTHCYRIVHEEILEEDRKIYEIIVAEPAQENLSLTSAEYLLGPILMNNQTEVFRKKWLRELHHRENISEQLRSAAANHQDKLDHLTKEINVIKEVVFSDT